MEIKHLPHVAKKRAITRAEAIASYVAIIRAPEPSEAQYATLSDVMETLRKSDDDLASDLRTIASADRCREEIQRVESPEFQKRLRAAQIARDEYLEESRQIIQQRNAAYQELRNAAYELERQQEVAGHDRTEQLRSLERVHWEILGVPKPEVKIP